MKKIINIISIFVAYFAFLFVITSCDNSNSNTDNDKQQTVASVDPESSSETKPSNPDSTVNPGHDSDQSEGHIHRFYETYIANEVSPTCTQNGSYDIVGICLDCKMEVREHKIIEKLGHDLIHYDAKNATCNTSGYKEYDKCSRCDYTTYEAIPALGHDYHKTDEFEATYDNDGYILYECSRCGDTYNEVTTKAQVCEKLSLGLNSNGFYYVEAKSTDIVGAVVIPKTYNGLPVKSITKDAFYNCSSLTSIELPNSVTSIGESAFSYCTALTNVYYDGTLEDWCNISFSNSYSNPMSYATNFYILDENGTIENNGRNYKLLTELEIPSTVKLIGNYQFYRFNQFTGITIPDSVTSIGQYAFEYCRSLTNITLPNSITSIGKYAFCGCTSLTSITIPNSVTSIGNSAFYNCSSLENVYYDGTIEDWCNITFSDEYSNPMNKATKFYILDENGDIENNGKKYKLLTELEIPSTVTSIGNYQFYGFNQFTGITIPDSVTSIGEGVFEKCASLISVIIPNNVTSIGRYAFYGCSSLTKVYYKGTSSYTDTITSIGDYNQSLTSATWYYFTSNGADETASGNWWYYDTDGKTIIEKVIL